MEVWAAADLLSEALIDIPHDNRRPTSQTAARGPRDTRKARSVCCCVLCDENGFIECVFGHRNVGVWWAALTA